MRRLIKILGASSVMLTLLSGAAGREQSAFDQYLAMKRVYEKELASYKSSSMTEDQGRSSDDILHDYQVILYDYGKSASYWARAQLEKAPGSRPPTIALLSTPPDKPTIASLDQNYENALQIEAAMWRSSAAGFPYSVMIPEEPPLPPRQDSRDPRFAKLIAMHGRVNMQIQAVLASSQEASRKATEAAARMGPPNPCQDPMGHNICAAPAPVNNSEPTNAQKQQDEEYRRQQEINGNLPK